jgi:hypothetical protein
MTLATTMLNLFSQFLQEKLTKNSILWEFTIGFSLIVGLSATLGFDESMVL